MGADADPESWILQTTPTVAGVGQANQADGFQQVQMAHFWERGRGGLGSRFLVVGQFLTYRIQHLYKFNGMSGTYTGTSALNHKSDALAVVHVSLFSPHLPSHTLAHRHTKHVQSVSWASEAADPVRSLLRCLFQPRWLHWLSQQWLLAQGETDD